MSAQYSGLRFERTVARNLRKQGFTIDTNVGIRGVSPDAVLRAKNGRVFAVDFKAYPMDHENAQRQLQLYRKATGLEHFYVVKGLKKSAPEQGIVSEHELAATLSHRAKRTIAVAWSSHRRGLAAKRHIPSRRAIAVARDRNRPKLTSKIIFAAMPFSDQYDDTFFNAMVPAAKQVGAACKRVDVEGVNGDVVIEIEHLIEGSIAVIADLSESRANVLYETGYAHALKRPTFHICSTSLKHLPFDVRNWNTVKYRIGQTYKLKTELSKLLRVWSAGTRH